MKLGTVLVVALGLAGCFVGGAYFERGARTQGLFDLGIGAGLVFMRIYETRK